MCLCLYLIKVIFHGIIDNLNYLHLTILTTVSVFIREILSIFVEYLEDLKLKDNFDNKPFNPSENKGEASSSSTGPSNSGKQPEHEKSIMDDPRNYQYDSDSESSQQYEWEEEYDETSYTMGANPEEFKGFLNEKNDIENIQNIKKNFEDAIEIYKTGVSLEADKQISYLQEKIETCDNKISQLETESKNKGKGKAE